MTFSPKKFLDECSWIIPEDPGCITTVNECRKQAASLTDSEKTGLVIAVLYALRETCGLAYAVRELGFSDIPDLVVETCNGLCLDEYLALAKNLVSQLGGR